MTYTGIQRSLFLIMTLCAVVLATFAHWSFGIVLVVGFLIGTAHGVAFNLADQAGEVPRKNE